MTRLNTILLLCILASCERWAEPPIPQVDYSDSQSPVIHESRSVIDSWYIGSVSLGEVINFKIQVTDTGNLVSNIYSRQVEKNWECNSSDSSLECSPYSLTEQCTAYYRDQVGRGSHFFDLSARENWPFRILIAGKEQRLSDSYTFHPPHLSTSLSVSEAMLSSGDDLTLEVIKPPGDLVEVGFMGFGKCQEVERRDLDIDPPKHDRPWSIFKWPNRKIDLQTTRVIHATLTREPQMPDQGLVVQGKWVLPNLKSGEVLHLQINAYKEENQWSEVYPKDTLAFWQARRCMRYFSNEELDCTPWEDKINSCKALYRKFKGVKETPIVLSERHEWPFKFSVGGVEYQLSNDYFFEGTTLYASLSIAPEMLSFGNDLTLEVIQPQQAEIKIGFLGYDESHCPGFGEEDFYTTANENSISIISSIRNRLNINIGRQSHD